MRRIHCRYNAFRGWRCAREHGHWGPCALYPRWWNLRDRWLFRDYL